MKKGPNRSRAASSWAEDVDRGRPQETAACRGDAGVAPGAGEGPAEERLHEDGGRTRGDRADDRAPAEGAAREIVRALRRNRAQRRTMLRHVAVYRTGGQYATRGKRGRWTGVEVSMISP